MLLALASLAAAFTPLPAPAARLTGAVRTEPIVCTHASSRRAALLAGGAAVASLLPRPSSAEPLPTSAALAFDLDDEEDRAVLQLGVIAAIILPSPFIGIQMVHLTGLAPSASPRLVERCAAAPQTRPPCPLAGARHHLERRRRGDQEVARGERGRAQPKQKKALRGSTTVDKALRGCGPRLFAHAVTRTG